METIFCPQCGAEATSDDFSCPKCESILNASAMEAEPTSVVQALLTRTARVVKQAPPRPPPPAPELGAAPPAPTVNASAAAVPPAKLIPRLRGGMDLALQPLPPLEAQLVSLIDGRSTVAEIAARAQISVIEVMATFQSEVLAGAVDVSTRPVAVPLSLPPAPLDPATQLDLRPPSVPGASALASVTRQRPGEAPPKTREGSGSKPAAKRPVEPPAPAPRATEARTGTATATPSSSTPAPPLMPRGLRLTAPSFEELRDGTSHRHVEANVGSAEPAVPPRIDAFAVTQPGLPPGTFKVQPPPEESAPPEPRRPLVLGTPDRTFRDPSFDDDEETATGSEPSIDPRRSLGAEARASLNRVTAATPAIDQRSSVKDAGEEDLFHASASLSADGRIVGPVVDDDVTPPRPVPSPLARAEDPDLTPPRGMPAAARVPAAALSSDVPVPMMPVGGRELELQVPDDAAPLELARDVRRSTSALPRTPFSDTTWTDSVLEQANALERDGDFGGAVQVLERAIATAPKPAALYNRLGLVMVKRSELRRASALLEKAVSLDPSNPIYRRNAEKVAQLSGSAATAPGSTEKVGKGRRDR